MSLLPHLTGPEATTLDAMMANIERGVGHAIARDHRGAGGGVSAGAREAPKCGPREARAECHQTLGMNRAVVFAA